MDNEHNTDTVTVGELYNAVDVICRAAANESSKLALIESLSEQFNPEMVSVMGVVNDNYADTLERMREAFGIKPDFITAGDKKLYEMEKKVAFCNQ